ncbi:MAG: hypothetical protein HY996_06110 [Micrococcales bacterium]|nr:hypothetical protein [Micrococcales bacterium]
MPTESELRDRMREPRPGGTGGLDAAAIVRAARRRRRPKVIAVGASALVVMAAIVVPTATLGLGALTTVSAGSSSGVRDAPAPSARTSDGGGVRGPEYVGRSGCGATASAPDTTGPLRATLELEPAIAGEPLRGALVLSNSGAAAATVQPGGAAVIRLARDGTVVGEGTAAVAGAPVVVAAGDRVRLPVSFRAVRCGTADALPAGGYDATVVLPLAAGAPGAGSEGVNGPPAAVTIR